MKLVCQLYLRFAFIFVLVTPSSASAVRIKDLVEVRGVRSNHLTGYGLVVGLPGTGDSRRTIFTSQAVSAMLLRHGVTVDPQTIDITNVAAVMITAELPPFASVGDKMDVMVSALGDARSLASGTLIRTTLKGPDGEIYGLAQGPLTVGGFGVANALLNIRRNNPTTARIPGGGMVEKALDSEFVNDNAIVLALKEKDFTTAGRLVDAINGALQGEVATALNAGQIKVQIPAAAQTSPVAFVSQLEAIDVVADSKARVVISEGTGTVVVGGDVTLSAAAVAHGNLNIAVTTQLGASQPGPLASGGSSLIVPNAGVSIEEDRGDVIALPATTTVEEMVRALNALGASSRDLMAIFQALKKAGALNAELEIM